MSIGAGATLTIAQDDSTFEVILGTECFEVLQKANAKRRLAWPFGSTNQTTKGMPEFEIVTHGASFCNTSLSPVPPLYITQWDGRVFMHSASLEEGYFILLILGFCNYSYCPTRPPLTFDLMLRVYDSNGFVFFQNHGPD